MRRVKQYNKCGEEKWMNRYFSWKNLQYNGHLDDLLVDKATTGK
jgi:hypothetical protein